MAIKRTKIKIKETIISLICEERFIPIAEKEIINQRKLLEDYIKNDPLFKSTLKPYIVPYNAPEIVKRMAVESAKAGVGPMACVAGAIAEYTLKALIKEGAKHAIVDNGGDIAMKINHPIIVGIYSGENVCNIGLKFYPCDSIIGICTSSATIGHSLSFGKADAVVVISKNVTLADAVATSLCNSIKQKDRKIIEENIESFMMDEIDGIMVFYGDIIGLAGNLPEIVQAEIDPILITKG
ncbi:UPF0280 family protein [Candidatus Aminicenantes bacterium AC-335-A11]|jgi:hypothetical protein|nr:UPF0280 family protein [SCandidatus Aminicenantes bacterium Aminicenantia_JdfR_composite]MCP2597885.1 UPF0280 family protein [Candidatus Aminicenantes bacterium AC-335-L06]MCP2618145.1 UPF0280 family protein [Candidatus Aminicenantes bacterium AC-335-A11]MCP2620458.1 UPF0280 family protein [Candidatus Aminicenantes bacterium AC-334-E05]